MQEIGQVARKELAGFPEYPTPSHFDPIFPKIDVTPISRRRDGRRRVRDPGQRRRTPEALRHKCVP